MYVCTIPELTLISETVCVRIPTNLYEPQFVLPGSDSKFKWFLVRREGHCLSHHDVVVQHLCRLVSTLHDVGTSLFVWDNLQYH